jgi:hypothetical protein
MNDLVARWMVKECRQKRPSSSVERMTENTLRLSIIYALQKQLQPHGLADNWNMFQRSVVKFCKRNKIHLSEPIENVPTERIILSNINDYYALAACFTPSQLKLLKTQQTIYISDRVRLYNHDTKLWTIL